MFKRKALKKLLKETVEASIIVGSRPGLSIDKLVLSILPDKVWQALSQKHFADISAEPAIINTATKVLEKRVKGFEKDLMDLLEDKVIYTKVKCPVCGDRIYTWKKEGESLATGVCLTCYKAMPKEEEEDGSEDVPDVPATPI